MLTYVFQAVLLIAVNPTDGLGYNHVVIHGRAFVDHVKQFCPYSGRFPQIVQSGCIFAEASSIPRKNLRFRASKSRKGTNPIRPNDAIPSLSLVRRTIIVATAPYSDALFVQTCKKNHPSLVSKLGWLYGTSNGNRTHDFALRGQRLNRLTMEADQPCG